MSDDGIKAFFDYAQDRYRLMLRRDSKARPPWTADPILQKYRFCNVFREDDKTTRWFRENVRDRHRDNPGVVTLWTFAFRWFNKIEIGEVLLHPEIGLDRGEFHANAAYNWIKSAYPKGPYVTGAYMVKTPLYKPKLEGVIECIDMFAPWAQMEATSMELGNRLEHAWHRLQAYPWMGPFMAYEVVTDLRWTRVLETATDVDTWANPGPGATRGVGRVFYDDPKRFNRNSTRDREVLIYAMRRLLDLSRTQEHCWPAAWPQWELREVEHTLCEFDKYERARLGEGRPKQLFKGEAA